MSRGKGEERSPVDRPRIRQSRLRVQKATHSRDKIFSFDGHWSTFFPKASAEVARILIQKVIGLPRSFLRFLAVFEETRHLASTAGSTGRASPLRTVRSRYSQNRRSKIPRPLSVPELSEGPLGQQNRGEYVPLRGALCDLHCKGPQPPSWGGSGPS